MATITNQRRGIEPEGFFAKPTVRLGAIFIIIAALATMAYILSLEPSPELLLKSVLVLLPGSMYVGYRALWLRG